MTDLDIKSMYQNEIISFMESIGEKAFRAKQVYSWLHEKQVDSYDDMTNLSLALRNKLKQIKPITAFAVKDVRVSKKSDTKKFLFGLDDGNVIESVWMKYHHGNSVCISSQVGCAMGCRFCASAIGGKVRSLTASEMLEQIYKITRITGERVSNVVVMGMGEPYDNYENLTRFIRIVTSETGLNMSVRNITVSTCGLVPQMYRFADEGLQVTLAVSLHAPNGEKRRELMPIANKYEIHDVVDAAKNYFKVTGRRVTFEYALVAGKNDSDTDAAQLSELLSGFPCHVNLIPVNSVVERDFKPSACEEIVNFKNKLEKNKINVTIRREMGADIDGACGQLRKSHMKSAEKVDINV